MSEYIAFDAHKRYTWVDRQDRSTGDTRAFRDDKRACPYHRICRRDQRAKAPPPKQLGRPRHEHPRNCCKITTPKWERDIHMSLTY
jgi:hypothetical protein